MPEPEPQPEPQPDWPLRDRARSGIIMATMAFAVIVLPTTLILAALAAAAGWWFGVDPARTALQGVAFGLIALAIGWIFTILRYIFRPGAVRRPTPSITRDPPK